MKKILVTGGCGYIGSHTIIELISNGYEVISVDNLSNSDESALESIRQITGKSIQNYIFDLCDPIATENIFSKHPDIEGVIHFAALKSVGDSVADPIGYFENNLNSLLNLIKSMTKHQISNLIFSSSCSVYGNAKSLPVTEDTAFENAASPYARTKQMGEQILEDWVQHTSFGKVVLLRYFNPVGAHPSALIGESSRNPPNNLVPVITETAIGKRPSMTVFGKNYPTRDGTCIRDYIHVCDIADAHVKALEYTFSKNDSFIDIFNLGTGTGVTVLECIQAFLKVADVPLNYILGDNREGDVVAVYANNEKAKKLLHWLPKYNIEEMMLTAWNWELHRSKKV